MSARNSITAAWSVAVSRLPPISKVFGTFALMVVFATPGYSASTLVRYPSGSDDAIAFVAHGDLWTARPDGASVRRLVRSSGRIVAARFSPDGVWVAYTERMQGGQDVFVVPFKGGAPRRLTFDSRAQIGSNLVVAWTPDSREVVFLSDRQAWAYKLLQAFAVPVNGGVIHTEPLGQSGSLAFSPDGQSVAFTRTFTDLATRKRYLGGQAEDIYSYNLVDHRLAQITDWKGTDTSPMWAGHALYFLSDRDPSFRLNVWRYSFDSGAVEQVTHFTDFDVDSPALGGGRILFQQGGHLWAIELKDQSLHEITLDVPDDGASTSSHIQRVGGEARRTDVSGRTDYAISPDGKYAILAAHGDLFDVSLDNGDRRNVTTTPAIDEDHPAVSPDGRSLAYVTEIDGEQQIAIRSLNGGPERPLTKFESSVFYTPIWSPDGRSIVVATAQHELWLIALDGASPTRLAFDPYAEIRDATFSSDCRWLAFSTERATGLSEIHLVDLHSNHARIVTPSLESDRLPTFSPDGALLLFVSQRNEFPVTGDRGDETTLATIASDGIYAVSLSGDLDNLSSRAVRLSVSPGRVNALETRARRILYETRPPALVGGELPGFPAVLHSLDLPTGKDEAILSHFENYVASADGEHILFLRDGGWHRLDLSTRRDRNIDVSQLFALVEPQQEWREMFEHAWRLDRDLFFSKVMNGGNWEEVHEAYKRFLPLLGSREDFLYLLGQVQGELGTSHAFISGLDVDIQSPVRHSRLGLDLIADAASGRYRVRRVFLGDPTRQRFRSPLNVPSLSGSTSPPIAGDYVLAIDGVDLAVPTDPDSLLVNASAHVSLRIADQNNGSVRTVILNPLSDDLDLRQHDWVESNRQYVDAVSHGRLGYVYLSDFSEPGSEELFRQLQGQLDKEGLVIDIRWNRGGFTSQAVLNLFKRLRAGTFVNRERAVSPLPLIAAPRAMSLIVNEETASDGDQFTYFFKSDHLGRIVGRRTWGGVQGIRGPWPLMDGARITIPKDSLASLDGHWLIENVGVEPDVSVARAPDELVAGTDSQLDAAVQAVLVQLDAVPAGMLKAPEPLPAYPKEGDVPGANFDSAKS